MIKYAKKSVSILLAIIMVVSMFTVLPISASAASGVTYLDANGATKTCSSYEAFTGQRTLGAEGETKWYVAESNYTYNTPDTWSQNISPFINVYGDVHLIIKDGVKISIGAFGIKVRSGSSLTIYAQSTGSSMGELYSNGTTGEGEYFGRREGYPGIDVNEATLIINGGTVTGQAGRNRIGIDCSGGTLTVNGGDVYGYSRHGNAYAGTGDPEGIGGINSTIVINGGHVYAKSAEDNYEGYAVGCAPRWGWSNITINGGDVEAYASSSDRFHAFGGTLTIADGLYLKEGNTIGELCYSESYTGKAKARVRAFIPVTNMTLNKTSSNLVVGKGTEQLSITSFTPSDATFNNARLVVWSSSDESVATVDQNGLVTPHWDGTAIISARIPNETEDVSDDVVVTCTVNVTVIHVSAVPLDKTNLNLFTYSRPVQLTSTIDPEDTSYQEIIWSTSDENVVTVTQNGLVTVQSPGSATITVRATNGTPDDPADDKISTCTVTVRVPDPITYLDYEGGKFVEKTITDYIHFDDTSVASVIDSNWGASGKETFVYVDTNETVDHRINALGNVHLIIADGASMTINGGLHVSRVNALTVHVQSLEKETTGQLTVSGGGYQAGIGGNLVPDGTYDEGADSSEEIAGSITINGGIVTARGGEFGAGIGSGGGLYTPAESASSIVINAGFIKAYGGLCAAGIGGGGSYYKFGGDGGNIIIRGGVVEAVGSSTGSICGGTGYLGNYAGQIEGANLSVASGLIIKAGSSIEDSVIYNPSEHYDRIESGYAYISPPVAADSFSLDKTSVTLTGDETVTLSPVNFVPAESSYTEMRYIKWTSSDDTIASVDANGLVRPLKEGTVTITATLNNGTPNDSSDDKTATCTVTVIFVGAEVSLDKSTLDLMWHGSSARLVSTISPANATIKKVVWTSSNPDVASVDQNGVVTPHEEGTATITVTAINGTPDDPSDDKSATCDVTVNFITSDITLDHSELELNANGATAKLTHSFEKEDASNKTVIWDSSDPSIASVDQNGTVKPIWNGKVTISVTAINRPDDPSDDTRALCTVTVVNAVPATEVVLDRTAITLEAKGFSDTLQATALPENATYRAITWTSENPSVATVDANGVVTPLTFGSAIIRATATNKPGDPSDDVSATCTVTVNPPTPTRYLAYDADSKTLTNKVCTDYIPVFPNASTWGADGQTTWLVLTKDITFNYDIVTIKGDVHLILKDGLTLNAKLGISVGEGSKLTVYAQSEDEATMGVLNATGYGEYSGIGGKWDENAGTITIDGGKITATGGGNGSGIGGNNGVFTVNGGIVKATGNGYGAGIGGGGNGANYGNGGVFTINGGHVTAIGGTNAAGIGGAGCDDYHWGGAGGSMTFNGGEVIAQSNGGRGIGGGCERDWDRGRDYEITVAEGFIVIADEEYHVWDDYPFRLRSSNVRVTAIRDVTDVTLDQENLDMIAGQGTYQLSATVAPIEAHEDVVWSSNDLRVATVSSSGVVTPVGGGTAVITARATNGTADTSDDVTATCTVNVTANSDVTYLERDTNTHRMVEKSITSYDKLDVNQTDWGNSEEDDPDDSTYYMPHWYFIEEDMTFNSHVTIRGNINLILKDGVTLTVNAPISLDYDSKLSIYSQSQDEATMGKLNVRGDSWWGALIGDNGTVTVHGGVVNADCGDNQIAVSTKTFNIYGGSVTARGNYNSAITSEQVSCVGVQAYAGFDEYSAEPVFDLPENHDHPYVHTLYDPDFVPTYNITSSADHGSVTIKKDGESVTSASAGDTVTLELIPDQGYALKSINAYEIYYIEELKQSPDKLLPLLKDLDVQGSDMSYRDMPDFSGLHFKTNENGALAVMNGNETVAEFASDAESEVAEFGSNIFFRFFYSSYNWAFAFRDNMITQISISKDGESIFLAYGGQYYSLSQSKKSNLSLTTVTEGSEYTFTMPFNEVYIEATFEDDSSVCTVTWKNGDEVIETDENVAVGSIPTFDGEIPAKEGYTFAGWTDGENTYGVNEPLPEVNENVTYTAVFSFNPERQENNRGERPCFTGNRQGQLLCIQVQCRGERN